MGKKVTIQDIADELGVSRNTVSKAFNGGEGLAPATRDRIIQKAMEMDYKQFSYVKTLAGISHNDIKVGETPNSYYGEVALLTTQYLSQSHFASLMLDKFQRELSLLGYTLNTHRVSKEDIASLTLPITFNKERISAVVCIEMFDEAYDRMICGLNMPVLFVDGPQKKDGSSLPADQLYMDNTTCMIQMVSEILNRGYRKIGFIGDYEHCQSFFERYCGFRLAMMLKGLEVNEKFIIKTNNKDILEKRLLALDEIPEVFFCANDFVAIDSIATLRFRDVRIPDDVLFCGFDDSPESRVFNPPLTTIHIHTQVMAFEAIHLLMSRMKEPSLDFRTVHTECDPIFRASTKD